MGGAGGVATADISIHAPAKGATHHLSSDSPLLHYFNPRSREGSDYLENYRELQRYVISIHAPAKGATFECIRGQAVESDFNPRSREGSDPNIIQQISFSLYNTVYFVSNNIK